MTVTHFLGAPAKANRNLRLIGRRKRYVTLLFALLLCACASPAAPLISPPACPPAANSAADSAVNAAATALPSPQRHAGFVVESRWPAELDRAAFEKMKRRAAEEHSTALLLLHDGKLIHASNPLGKGDLNKPSYAMSVSKSVVALLVGQLIEEGALKLDEPLSASLVPEWRGGDKAAITLRHLLNHTSGLDPVRAIATSSKEEDAALLDIEESALRAKLDDPPGRRFRYNNQAVDFISVLVRRALGPRTRLDDQLQVRLFGPLHVLGASWVKDIHGDPLAAGELRVRPIDLAKVGQLVLQRGRWNGQQLVSEAWLEQMLAPGQKLVRSCGLLWWRDYGDSKGASSTKGEDNKARNEVLAYRADGYLGQYILVVPSQRLVAVRMRDAERTSWNAKEFNYEDFRSDVLAIAKLNKR